MSKATPVALGIIRTDLAGHDTAVQQNRMIRRIEQAGCLPLIEYALGPIAPDELSESVSRMGASVVVMWDFDAMGAAGLTAARDLADVWFMSPVEAYRRTCSGSAGVRKGVRETLEQAGQRIKGELAAEVAKLDEVLGKNRAATAG